MPFEEPLYLDVQDDLRRVDEAMNQLLSDRRQWEGFLEDPNGTLIRLGLHPETDEQINDRVNRIFWLTLTDTDLLKMIGQRYSKFTPDRAKELERYFLEGLMEGVIRHDVQYDLQAIEYFLEDEDLLRKSLLRNLTRINEAGVLERQYTQDQLGEYADAVVRSIANRESAAEHPKLEVWDDFYGIGQPFGGVFWEVGAVATAAVGVEVGAYVTAVLEVGFWGVVAERFVQRAVEGDEAAIRAVAVAGRLADFGGELLAHAHGVQRAS